jgi:hypothetical protein
VPERLDERAQLGSVVQSAKEQLATTTLLVFHAASAVADGMALAQSWSLPIALNLALRVVMVVLLLAFRVRREQH